MDDKKNDLDETLKEINAIFTDEDTEKYLENIQDCIKPMSDDMVKMCYALFEIELRQRDIDPENIY